jgi:hypothetical protein
MSALPTVPPVSPPAVTHADIQLQAQVQVELCSEATKQTYLLVRPVVGQKRRRIAALGPKA